MKPETAEWLDKAVVFIGDSEVEVYQWVHKTALTPMPLVFRIPREADLHTIL